MVFSTITVAMLFGVVFAKYLVGTRLQKLRQRALESETSVRRTRAQMKAAGNVSAVEKRSMRTKDRKKRAMERQIEILKKELADLGR